MRIRNSSNLYSVGNSVSNWPSRLASWLIRFSSRSATRSVVAWAVTVFCRRSSTSTRAAISSVAKGLVR
ncbi:hypothetical protein D3C84_1019770 [compost metagenome]